MSGFGDWMIDTFIYTGVLIALVLLVRRPVSRWCGPQVAYALWALPFLRFIMPPIVLPAWMAPAEPETVAVASAEPLMVIISDPVESAVATQAAAAPVVDVAVADLLLPLWIGGALVFLGWRLREYLQMRKVLLVNAVPVGEAGKVRLVETPAVSGPVAFGIIDKVVALPPAFMAHYDITARDMAIAHELAHHRGYDLVANIAAQPLLALHWFNPLAWWGWRAMRRDQEAACDARVVAGRAQNERAAYAQVIAGFATGDHHLALAAPMACPVLGEKSIIHRLRSLTMSDVSSGRRRLGIAAITTTALALPLTASISYAQGEPPLPPEPPAAPLPPEAPQAPDAPLPPQAPDAPTIESVDPNVEVEVQYDEDTGERRVIRRITRNGEPMSEAELEEHMARLEAEMERRHEEIEVIVERAAAQAEHAREMGEHAREMEVRMRTMAANAPQAELDCEGVDDSGVVERDLGNGRRAVVICERIIRESAVAGMQGAVQGLRAAIEEIRGNDEIPAGMRDEIIRSLQQAVEEMQREGVTAARARSKARADAGRTAPDARPTAVALRWQGRMVSPIRVSAPVRMQAPEPVFAPIPITAVEDNCDERTVRA